MLFSTLVVEAVAGLVAVRELELAYRAPPFGELFSPNELRRMFITETPLAELELETAPP